MIAWAGVEFLPMTKVFKISLSASNGLTSKRITVTIQICMFIIAQ